MIDKSVFQPQEFDLEFNTSKERISSWQTRFPDFQSDYCY